MADTGIPPGPTTKKMLGSSADCVSVNAAITITFQTDKVSRTIVRQMPYLCKEPGAGTSNGVTTLFLSQAPVKQSVIPPS